MEQQLMCFICGKYFAGPFHKKHQQQCLGTRNEQIVDLQKQIPNIEIPPAEEPQLLPPTTNEKEAIDQYNDQALECFQKAFVPCPKCKKTFHLSRIEVHHRNCKTDPLDLAQVPGRKKRGSRDEGQRGPITPRRSLEPQSSTPERVAMLKKKSFNASDDELLLTVGDSQPSTGRARPMSSPNVLETTSTFDKLDALSFPSNNLQLSNSSNGSSSDSRGSTSPEGARRSFSVGGNVRKMVGGIEAKSVTANSPDKQKLIGHVRASLTLLKQRISKGNSFHPLQSSMSTDDAYTLYQSQNKFHQVVRLPVIEKPKPTKKPVVKKQIPKFAYQGKERTQSVLKLPNIHKPTRIPILRARYSHYYHTFPKDRVHNHIFILQSWLSHVAKDKQQKEEESTEAESDTGSNSASEPSEASEPEQVVAKSPEIEKPVETKQVKIEPLKKKPTEEEVTRFPPLKATSRESNHVQAPLQKKEDTGLPRYCSKCGVKFPGDGPQYRFCGSCGQERKWREPHAIYNQHFYAEPRIVEERVR